MAMSSIMAFSNAARVITSRGFGPSANAISTIRLAAAAYSRLRSVLVARIVPFPGSAMPSASARQFMLLAVNMPEQLPQVGQAWFSMSVRVWSSRLPAACWLTA